MQKLYYDINRPTAFSHNKHFLLKQARKINKKIKISDVETWLHSQTNYNKYKKVISRFKRVPYLSRGINYQLAVDLLDVSNLSKYNNNTKYLLGILDIFTRKLRL